MKIDEHYPHTQYYENLHSNSSRLTLWLLLLPLLHLHPQQIYHLRVGLTHLLLLTTLVLVLSVCPLLTLQTLHQILLFTLPVTVDFLLVWGGFHRHLNLQMQILFTCFCEHLLTSFVEPLVLLRMIGWNSVDPFSVVIWGV